MEKWGMFEFNTPYVGEIIEKINDVVLPNDYIEFMKRHNGGQGDIGETSEADVLNMALFGMTAKQWREEHPDKKRNIRDYASINELICLSNMENINAVLIEDGLSQKERLIKLNKIAIHQMSILEEQNPKVLK